MKDRAQAKKAAMLAKIRALCATFLRAIEPPWSAISSVLEQAFLLRGGRYQSKD